MGYDLMDDPTWCCDYIPRCQNKVIKLFLQDLEDNNDIEDVRNKWDEIYKENEGKDK